MLKIALITFIWYGLGQVALSFTIEKPIEAIIELAIVAIAIFIFIDGRIFQKLKDRRVRGFFLVPIYLLIAAMIYDVIIALQLNDLFVLDQPHTFGLIAYIISAGLIILIAIMLRETVALTWDYYVSNK